MIPALAIVLAIAVTAVVIVDRRAVYAPTAGGFTPSVALLLARVEGGRLLRHPLVWVAILAGLAGFPFLGGGEDWQVRWGLTGEYLSLLAAVAFVVVHFAVSRDRRSGTDELVASLPTGPATRVPGHLLSSLWLLVPVTVLWSAYLWWRFAPSGGITIADGNLSYRWAPPVAEVAQGPVMVAVVLLLAVAAGVWWRHPVAGVLVPLLLFFSPLLWMVPLTMDVGPIAPYLQNRIVHVSYGYLVWHYLFMAGLGTLAVAAAMLRRGPRALWGAVAALAGVALWAGFVLRRHEWLGL